MEELLQMQELSVHNSLFDTINIHSTLLRYYLATTCIANNMVS